MSIFKRGGTYWYHFIFNGQHVQKSTKQGNPRTARQIEAAFRTALAKGEVGIVERKKIPLFKAAMADFLTWSEHEHQAHPATYRRYKTSSVALLRHFNQAPLDKITPDEVERYKTVRLNQTTTVRAKDKRRSTGKKLRPATVNRELACLRAVFNHIIKGDVALRNPISKTAAKSLQEDNEQTRVVTYDEQVKYLAHATTTLSDVATLMLGTGMRPEEVYRIRPENVHLDENYLFNPYGKTKAAKRRIKLTTAGKAVLSRRMIACNEAKGTYLFPHATDEKRPVPKVNSAHDRAVKDSKVAHFRLYDLRHTWATRAVEAGIDLVTLAAMLGHSKINMVLRYAHPTQEHQTKAMERMEQFVLAQQIASAEKQAPNLSQAIQ
jgi:integrase